MKKTLVTLQNGKSKKPAAYVGLFFVVLVWGFIPFFTLQLNKYYSPTFRVFFSEVILLTTYIIMSKKHIKGFNFQYIKIGIPTGFFLTLANICQKIGLLYTTPAKYAFLENLSCITVPVLMYILVKKKPGFATVLSCILCLISIFVLNGMSLQDASSWGVGEILCAVAGLLYGFNIAGTSVYAKNLYAPLYLAVQSFVGIAVSFIFSVILHFTNYTTAEGVKMPIEKIVFSAKPQHIIFAAAVAIVSSALCWTIRTNAMKHINASTVAIIMPFSAVITGVVSVLIGTDELNVNLIVGAILGFAAIVMSSFDDIFKRNIKTADN